MGLFGCATIRSLRQTSLTMAGGSCLMEVAPSSTTAVQTVPIKKEEANEAVEIPEGLDQPRPVSPIVISVGELRTPSGDELNPMPPRAAITAGGGEANAHIAWSASGAYLAVKDEPESVARRLRFAIQRSGMNLVERNDDGSHRFEYRHARTPVEKGFFEKMLFWKNDMGPDYSGAYRLRLQPDGKLG